MTDRPPARPRRRTHLRPAEEVVDASWALTVTGSGPTLVLLHGLGAASSTWDQVVPRLADRFTVVQVDLPGHGGSEFHHHDCDFAQLADELEQVLCRRGIEDFTLAGHSFGGALALQYAMVGPRTPTAQRVVLIDAGGLGREISVFVRALGWPGASLVFDGLYSRRVSRTLSGLARRRARDRLVGAASSGSANMRDIARNLANPLTRTALRHYLSFSLDGRGQVEGLFEQSLPLHQPTLIVWGENDVILPVRQAHRAHRLLRGSELLVLPGVGHCPPKQAPDAVADALARFAAGQRVG